MGLQFFGIPLGTPFRVCFPGILSYCLLKIAPSHCVEFNSQITMFAL